MGIGQGTSAAPQWLGAEDDRNNSDRNGFPPDTPLTLMRTRQRFPSTLHTPPPTPPPPSCRHHSLAVIVLPPHPDNPSPSGPTPRSPPFPPPAWCSRARRRRWGRRRTRGSWGGTIVMTVALPLMIWTLATSVPVVRRLVPEPSSGSQFADAFGRSFLATSPTPPSGPKSSSGRPDQRTCGSRPESGILGGAYGRSFSPGANTLVLLSCLRSSHRRHD